MTIQDVLNIEFPAEFGSDEDGEITEAMEDVYAQLEHGSANTAFGATKFVIFLNDKEVAKIPFNGAFWYDSYQDWNFYEFYVEDYCAREANIYEKAEDEGIEEFFAYTKYCGNSVCGKPVYVSERVYTFYDNDRVREKTNSFSMNSMERAKELKDKLSTRLHEEWVARAIEYYGFEAVQKLFDFIEKEDIRDLHCDNVGFREDGSPCILDYSSYYEG